MIGRTLFWPAPGSTGEAVCRFFLATPGASLTKDEIAERFGAVSPASAMWPCVVTGLVACEGDMTGTGAGIYRAGHRLAEASRGVPLNSLEHA